MSSSSEESRFLRRVPSRYTASLLSRTDSTVSGISGAGRTVGDLLYSAGRRIEPVLSRAAERLGFGPTPLVRRLLTMIVNRHNKDCELHLDQGTISAETILFLAHSPCPDCSEPIDFGLDGLKNAVTVVESVFAKLLEYLQSVAKSSNRHVFGSPSLLTHVPSHSEPSTRQLALYYIAVLSQAHENFCDWFTELGAVSIIQDLEILSRDPFENRWNGLAIPSAQCLEVLSTASARPLRDRTCPGLLARLLVVIMKTHQAHCHCDPYLFTLHEVGNIWKGALLEGEIVPSIDVATRILCHPCPHCCLMPSEVIGGTDEKNDILDVLRVLLSYAKFR